MKLEMAKGLGAMPRSLGSSHATAENGQDKEGYARLRWAFQKDPSGIKMLQQEERRDGDPGEVEVGGEEGAETGGTPVYSWKWTVCCRDWDADIFPHKQRRKEAIWVLHGSSWEKTQEDGEGG